MIDVPLRLDDISPEWLTAALAEGGLDVAPAASVTQDVIGDVAGMTGAIARLHVAYADDGPPGPASLIAKCPLDDDINRLVNTFTRMYERESSFYEHFAADGAVRVPHCFYNGYQADTDQHMLLLEDLDGARSGDNNVGLSPADAEVAVDALGALHGRYWGRLEGHPGAKDYSDPIFRAGIPTMQQAWAELRDTRPDLVPDGLARVVEHWYVDDWDRWQALEQATDHTLVHGDYRADNMLFDDHGVTIIDWQMLCRSTPGMDLAWLLGTSFADDVIEAHEHELIGRWRAAVAAAGGPELDDAAIRYLLWIGGFFWITGVAHVFTREFDDPHLRALQLTLGERMVRACVRWDLAAFEPA